MRIEIKDRDPELKPGKLDTMVVVKADRGELAVVFEDDNDDKALLFISGLSKGEQVVDPPDWGPWTVVGVMEVKD